MNADVVEFTETQQWVGKLQAVMFFSQSMEQSSVLFAL